MGVCEFFGRIVLVVINVILVFVSIAMIAFGFLVKYSADILKKYTDKVLQKISSSADGILDAKIDISKFDLGELFGGVATMLIVIGFLLLALSFFGCCGAVCGVKTMLVVYSMVLIILVLAQIVFVILLFGFPDVLKNAIKRPLKTLLNHYQGLNGTNVESLGWNFIMQEFDCCGVENYEDFKQGNTDWFGENDSKWKTPLACCKDLPDLSDLSCANGTLDATKNNFDKGCVKEIWEKLMDQNKLYTGLGVGLILGFQILLIVFAIVLCRKDDGKKVHPRY